LSEIKTFTKACKNVSRAVVKITTTTTVRWFTIKYYFVLKNQQVFLYCFFSHIHKTMTTFPLLFHLFSKSCNSIKCVLCSYLTLHHNYFITIRKTIEKTLRLFFCPFFRPDFSHFPTANLLTCIAKNHCIDLSSTFSTK